MMARDLLRHPRRMPPALALLLLIATVAANAAAAMQPASGTADDAKQNDAIVLYDTAIPIRPVEVIDVQAGRVYYLDARGRREYRDVRDVSALFLADLPALEMAHEAQSAGADREAKRRLILAAHEASADLQRTWARIALVRAHRNAGENVEAIGSLAALLRLDPDPVWRSLRPRTEATTPPTPIALAEARMNIDEALRSIDRADVRQLLEHLREEVDALAERWAIEPPAAPKRDEDDNAPSTVSGLTRAEVEQLLGDVPPVSQSDESGARSQDQPSAPSNRDADQPRTAPAVPQPEAPPSGDLLGPIRDALDTGDARTALARCRGAAVLVADSDRPQLFHLYARAFDASGDDERAILYHLRCGLMHPTSPYAGSSLLRASQLHREIHQDLPAARRLAERALTIARAQRRDDLIDACRRWLADLDAAFESGDDAPSTTNNPSPAEAANPSKEP